MAEIDEPRPPEIDSIITMKATSKTTNFLAYGTLLAHALMYGSLGSAGLGVLGWIGAASMVTITVVLFLHTQKQQERFPDFEVKHHLFPGRWTQSRDGEWQRIGHE